MKKLLILISIFFSFFLLKAQSPPESLPAWLIQPSLAVQFPGGDMKTWFGTNYTLGIGAGYKTKENWIFSLDLQYIFGDHVKNIGYLLNPVLSDKGYVFNTTGNYAELNVFERGYYGNLEVSKTLGFWNLNPNSGPVISLGGGYLAHRIRLNNNGNDSPQVLDEYEKGYDHLSGGPMLKQSIGYIFLSNNHRINVKLSFEVIEAFTTNLRGFDYTTGKPVSGTMNDLLYGFRAQWILPIYSKGAQTYYYD